MKNNEKKTHAAPVLIIGIIIYLVTFMMQGKISQMTAQGNSALSGLNGVISQVQVLASVVMVVMTHKKGMITSTVLNLLNGVYVLVFAVIISQNPRSLPGTVAPVITIVTCFVIYSYHVKARKANEELTKTNNELLETNRVIREKDEKLIYLAYYDVLTGLANRQLFIDQIDEMIAKDNSSPFTVITANIDDFKNINDSFGHNTGDIMLSTYADRLRTFCGNSVFIGKLGGDEYALIVKGDHTEASIVSYIQNLCAEVCAPVQVNGAAHQTSMSFGVASYPRDGRNSAEILRSTDIAVTNAKANGRGRTCFYSGSAQA